eukprot:gene1367-1800_t
MQAIQKFMQQEDGVTAIEYGLIAALIAVVIIGGVTTVGTKLSEQSGTAHCSGPIQLDFLRRQAPARPTMKQRLSRVLQSSSAVTSIEYALLGSLIASIVILGATTFALPRNLASALRAHRWLALAVAVHVLAAAAIRARYHSGAGAGTLLAGYLSSLLVGPVFALAGYALHVMLFARPRQLLRHMGRELRTYLSRERVLFALPAIVLLSLFAASFTEIK